MSVPSPDFAAAAAPALADAVAALEAVRREVPTADLAARLDAFETLSDDLLNRRDARIPGAAFLAAFLRRAHIEELLSRELPDIRALDAFVPAGARSELRILPRGLVCHWIAGNVPLLGVFSWALSAVFGNANLIRVSSRAEDVMTPVVERVATLSEAGAEMAARTRVVSFEREDEQSHAAMSAAADLRIAWGGEEAVASVRALPAQWECDDLVFGPRRSFAVVDPAETSERVVGRLASDIVYFDQLACSSPQVVFVKGQRDTPAMDGFLTALATAVEGAVRQFKRHTLDWAETYRIELDRQRAVLEGANVLRDEATEWTIALLDAPVNQISCANRFVQVVPFTDLEAVSAAIPRNVQTVILSIASDTAGAYAEALARRGVCRFPRPGLGNSFEIPWDGLAVAPRLGHWVTRAL